MQRRRVHIYIASRRLSGTRGVSTQPRTQPATQGKRFLEYLDTSDVVSIFDKDHSQVDEIRKADFRYITVCSITLDQFTEFAARVQHLGPIGICQEDSPIWSISLDDLRVFADLFTNPLIFIHFVEQRLRAFESDAVECNDELDHVGLYFEHIIMHTILRA